MGLDMYLYKATEEFNVNDCNIGHKITLEQVGYWRKANEIHYYIVNHHQDGVDDCRLTCLYKEDLEELRAKCQEVLKNPKNASELLPTESGFFFGSTEYDDWYFADIIDTIHIINDALKEDCDEFFYQSSW